MSSNSSQRLVQIDRIVQQFLEQWRGGEAPEIDRFADDYPGFEAEIRELLPTLLAMEQAKQHNTDTSDDLLVDSDRPKTIDDYRLIREIGRGGMGVVYEAQQVSLRRRVAFENPAP